MTDINDIKKRALSKIGEARDIKALEVARVEFLGRKGELTVILRGVKDLSVEKRRTIGKKANMIRDELQRGIEKKVKEFGKDSYMGDFDITRPGAKPPMGHIHPLSKVMQEVRDIFVAMNFSVVEGPEVETEYYNFDALNLPAHHPAREMWDTFWLKQTKGVKKDRLLLRTHTSPVQIRYMEEFEPPFQIIVPGRTFRYEATDATHETNFHQVEGLMVGKDISLANYKYVIEKFFQEFFKEISGDIKIRFRPSYFPFVEPGVEVDVKLGKGKWLEMMGAGMVHPNVFEAARYNPRDWQGFAFGVGIDRLAMIKYNIPDIRLSYSGDLRFINQF